MRAKRRKPANGPCVELVRARFRNPTRRKPDFPRVVIQGIGFHLRALQIRPISGATRHFKPMSGASLLRIAWP
jgi:hypothetical protein